jgi:two-component system nitrate/nitrite response regulator NarL
MSKTEPIRVGIIEDHNIVLAGIKFMLAAYPDIEVVGDAADQKAAFELAKSKRPAVLLVDLQLGEVSALDFLEELMAVGSARTIVVTGSSNEEEIHRSIQAGATGLVFKHEDPDVLVRAIRKVHAGEAWLSRSLMTSALSRLRASRQAPADPEAEKIATLTARERQVVELVATGLGRHGIAEKLCVSEGTVRNHLTSIFGKLDLSNQLGLVFYAQRHGLDKPVIPNSHR